MNNNTAKLPSQSIGGQKRILALDILRGMTIAGMILVNDPGSWAHIYTPLDHSEWNGLTPTDLVFPFFMFIMGISMYISLKKFNFEFTAPTAKKIIKRTVLLYLVGLAIAWFSLTLRTFNNLADQDLPFLSRLGQSMWNFDRIRILGVIPRLAITYGIGSFIVLFVKHKHLPYLIGIILLGYYVLLMLGNGFVYGTENILSKVDFKILGANHMYKDNGIEPEGILSTIPAIAHVLLGFYIGKIMMTTKDINQKIERLFIVGAILTFSGLLLSYGCPINKKVWSPTFVLTTIGFGSTLLALLIWIIDVKGYKKWTMFFETFGVNPLFLYVLAAFLTIIFMNIHFVFEGAQTNIIGFSFTVFSKFLNPLNASLLYALLFVGLNWIIGYYLYKKKIYIKL